MLVIVENEHYRQVEDAAKNMWANSKKGFYGSGIINSKKDPTRVERTGLLGQAAFSIITGLHTDFSYRKGGDKYDFLIHNYKVDVKTASRDYGAALIKCINEWGKNCFREQDIYIAAYIVMDNYEDKVAQVCFKGYELGKRVRDFPIKNARQGVHKNYELTYNKLRPMEVLLDFIKGDRQFSQL
jgi:hypothetical protein